ncbi:cortex morphogenetic protein CmpA [Fodinisporobacter ferrooxydans]|uniref:Cortex morphogenetic protein CmpA n=1 Tax=Fodinisporobacter ferrooxydans TaxID=2901836 RepID=A0ABY4CMW2_9BACL|nr:cortex morphogenetic protein CmpA [Alicyclobacillaceae bacterium MYW30-H2]
MPSWLRNQLARAFSEHDKRSVIMLNRVFYKYRAFTISQAKTTSTNQ